MADKTQENLSTKEGLKSLHNLRLEFWNRLLTLMKGKTTIFQNSIATTASSISAGGTGIGSIGYVFEIKKNFVSVTFAMNRPFKAENKKIFCYLKEYKTKIETNFGDELKWEPLDDIIGSRISYSSDKVNISDKDEWDRILDFLSTRMIKLEEALRGPLLNVKSKFKGTEESY